MGNRVAVLGAAVLLLAPAVPACSGKVDNAVHVDGIRAQIESTPSWIDPGDLGARLWAIERGFYESRGFVPAWVDGDRTTPHMDDLMRQFRNSELHGLDPSRYPIEEFERIHLQSQTRKGTRFDLGLVPELDAKLTYGYLLYASELIGWNSGPEQVSRNWTAAPGEEHDLAARLADAIASNRLGDSLETLAPSHPQYKGLQAALARREHTPADVEKIRMNLERWRWMPRDLGDRYVLVNVPGYMLHVMEGDEPALSMRVIVGRTVTQTPIFSDEMTYVVFSPYWNIPENILRDETLPRAVKDPGFLRRNNMEVVGTSGTIDPESIDWSDRSAMSGLRFRQRPGPGNALGLVKFIFPNQHSIYLHDTPGDRMFFREHRTFSHGCIRVEDPAALAEYVLRDQPQWTERRITAAMHGGQEQHVMLKAKLPVHIGYWTAWVQPDGSVAFLDDPYKFDPVHARLMENQLESAGSWPTPESASRSQS